MATTQTPTNPIDLRRKIFQIDRLASMPEVTWRLVDALGDDNSGAAQLEAIIESDPALAGKVLSLANSAYYGFGKNVTTVARAIVIIGVQELHMLALGAGLSEAFDFRKIPPFLDGVSLWFHCLAVSWAARELAETAGHPNPAEAMTCGLLHDLGKLVMAVNLIEETTRLQKAVEDGAPYYQAEKDLGLSHTMVGTWLAKRWGLPRLHRAVIGGHHDPESETEYFQTVALVCLADKMVKGLGFGPQHESPPLDYEGISFKTGLPPEKMDAVTQRAKDRIPAMFESWRKL